MIAELGDDQPQGFLVANESVILIHPVEEGHGLGGAAGTDEAVDGGLEALGAGDASGMGEDFVDGLEVLAAAEVADEAGDGGVVEGEAGDGRHIVEKVEGGAAGIGGDVEGGEEEVGRGRERDQIEPLGEREGIGFGVLEELGGDRPSYGGVVGRGLGGEGPRERNEG